MNRKAYSSDLSDAEWALLAPFIPPVLPGGRPRSTDMREVLDAIFYILRGGCAWRLLPHEFPKWQTVYHYMRAWRRAYLATDAYLQWRPSAALANGGEDKKHYGYRWIVLWVIVSPLFWILVKQSDFVGLTLTVNTLQVVILPALVLGVWLITAKTKYIGAKYRNRWWENTIMAFLLLLACIGAFFAVVTVKGLIK